MKFGASNDEDEAEQKYIQDKLDKMIKTNRIGPLVGPKTDQQILASSSSRASLSGKQTEARQTPKTGERQLSKSRLGSGTRRRSGSASRRLVFGSQNTP